MTVGIASRSKETRYIVKEEAARLGLKLVASAFDPEALLGAAENIDILCIHSETVADSVLHGAFGTTALLVLGPCDASWVADEMSRRPLCALGTEWSAGDIEVGLRALSLGLSLVDPAILRHGTHPPQNAPTHDLSSRERQILSFLQRGLSNLDIAERLGLSTNTIKFHLAAIYEKLDVHSRAEAVYVATREGLLSM